MREQLDSLKRKLSEANENRETMEILRHQLAEKSQEMESALEEAAALKVKLEKTEASTVLPKHYLGRRTQWPEAADKRNWPTSRNVCIKSNRSLKSFVFEAGRL